MECAFRERYPYGPDSLHYSHDRCGEKALWRFSTEGGARAWSIFICEKHEEQYKEHIRLDRYELKQQVKRNEDGTFPEVTYYRSK